MSGTATMLSSSVANTIINTESNPFAVAAAPTPVWGDSGVGRSIGQVPMAAGAVITPTNNNNTNSNNMVNYNAVPSSSTTTTTTTTPLDAMIAAEMAVSATSPQRKKIRATICRYTVNGGLDYKYESEKFPAALRGVLTFDEFKDVINKLNNAAAETRSTGVDHVSLFIPLFAPSMHTR